MITIDPFQIVIVSILTAKHCIISSLMVMSGDIFSICKDLNSRQNLQLCMRKNIYKLPVKEEFYL
ncbi:hypothetical protein BGZ63DRAFT_392620 [Mariannaea sp. PMI_226]|nr:hypothetical protein BGZ63DRAFT_392620 [Mariannaea sp. PMI_226]